MPAVSLQRRIESSLARTKAAVFLRRDFNRFGGYDPVSRALRGIVAKGRLVKAGYGVYVKARRSGLTGNPIPVLSVIEIGLQTMEKLGIKAELGASAKAYAAGISTQMPMASVVNVGKARVSRKIGFGAKTVRYERDGRPKTRPARRSQRVLATSSEEVRGVASRPPASPPQREDIIDLLDKTIATGENEITIRGLAAELDDAEIEAFIAAERERQKGTRS